MNDTIRIKGARENNLKNVDLTIPRDKLVVFTGLSGSGKSSLAFDTIYAEGQRRYVESLSSYARQFLGQMDKPDVDSIDGLSPAISIDQKTTSKNPRSTVGTVTETGSVAVTVSVSGTVAGTVAETVGSGIAEEGEQAVNWNSKTHRKSMVIFFMKPPQSASIGQL